MDAPATDDPKLPELSLLGEGLDAIVDTNARSSDPGNDRRLDRYHDAVKLCGVEVTDQRRMAGLRLQRNLELYGTTVKPERAKVVRMPSRRKGK